MLDWLKQKAPDKSDLFLYLGTGFLAYGAFLIYPPAAFITIGSVFIILAAIQARSFAIHSSVENKESE